MQELINFLKAAEGTAFTNEDGVTDKFALLPPLTEAEIGRLEAKLPCPLPAEIHELLRFARGFSGGPLEEVTFADLNEGFGLEEIFPHAQALAADGFGNYWVIDLTPTSTSWGPIFYACHDASVIVFQTASLTHFVEECIRFGNVPWKSEINDAHEELSNRIWRENPLVLSYAQCVSGSDESLREFSRSLDESWEFIDLREAKLGDGFSWGRYGPKTKTKRFRYERIFACQRFKDALK